MPPFVIPSLPANAKTVVLAKEHLQKAPAVRIGQESWPDPRNPCLVRARCRPGWNRHGLFLRFEVNEPSIRGFCTRPNQPVCRDSCVEFFVSLGKVYRNFEFNCIGTCLLGHGAERPHRKRLSERRIAHIQTVSSLGTRRILLQEGGFRWDLTVRIPPDLLLEAWEDLSSGKEIRGNFYKCGDQLPNRHYLSWKKIHAPLPDFHQPEFFGSLIAG